MRDRWRLGRLRTNQEVIYTSSSPACRFCRSANIVKAGWRYNRNGRKRRALCKACGKRFTVDDGFLHMWYNKQAVTEAVDLYHDGLSTRKVANHLKKHGRYWPSWTSVWRWVHKFAGLVKQFIVKLTPKLSKRWQADEMCLFIRGKLCWNWEVMDEGTRFWLASRLSEGWDRGIGDAEAVLKLARDRAKCKPSTLVTDGLPAYERGSHWALGWRHCKHERSVSWREGKGLTNLIERKIQTTRMRTKTMRCLKGLETGQNWLEGAQIHYNFVRPHTALDRTPAEAAGLSLKLGRNAWLGLITLSVKIFFLVYLPKMKQNPQLIFSLQGFSKSMGLIGNQFSRFDLVRPQKLWMRRR